MLIIHWFIDWVVYTSHCLGNKAVTSHWRSLPFWLRSIQKLSPLSVVVNDNGKESQLEFEKCEVSINEITCSLLLIDLLPRQWSWCCWFDVDSINESINEKRDIYRGVFRIKQSSTAAQVQTFRKIFLTLKFFWEKKKLTIPLGTKNPGIFQYIRNY